MHAYTQQLNNNERIALPIQSQRINQSTQCLIHSLTQQTFATRRSIVCPARWTIAACSAARRVRALAFAVATTVVLQALVHV